MSVESMAIAFNHSRATSTAKLILLGIANHDGDGGAWPSVATLARYGNVTPRNAQKAIARLEELGEIRVHVQQGGNARTPDHAKPNLYEFILTCSPDCDRSKNHNSKYVLPDPLSVASPPVGSDTPPPVGSDTRPLSVATPEPPFNYPQEIRSSQGNQQRAAKVPPAPTYPRASERAPEPERPPLSDEQRNLARAAEQIHCAAQGGKFRHMIAPDLTCARCGTEAAVILERNQA